MKSKVYYSKKNDSQTALELYKLVSQQISGNVAIKIHSGEVGNQNFLKPEFWKPVIDYINGILVECNTAYEGGRNTTEKHMETMKNHGWLKHFDVDIMDSEAPDLVLEIPNGVKIKRNFVGKNIQKYDSMVVLSHFKGHPMGGYGGALKQLSIGVASSYGKAFIHGAGVPEEIWTADHDSFLESMADAAAAVVNYFNRKIAYVNVMKNLSVDCDCCEIAEDPCMNDMGILASTDPVAIDQACLDLVYASKDKGRDHLIERIESRNGAHTIDTAEKLGIGSKEYELIEL